MYAMRYVEIGIVLLGVVIIGIGMVSILGYQAPPPLPALVPEAQYLPGKPLPGANQCMWAIDDEHLLYCSVLRDNHLYLSFTFDRAKGVIIQTVKPIGTIKVARLITAWGKPTAYIVYSQAVYVYWGNCAALIYTDALGPEDDVAAINCELDTSDQHSWRGFVVNDNLRSAGF